MDNLTGRLTAVAVAVLAAALLFGGHLRAAETTVQVIAPETRYTPWLGLTLSEGYAPDGVFEGVSGGLVVVDVTEGGPADSAGIEKGDAIISFDGRLIEAYDDFSGWLRELGVGSSVKLLVDKGGQLKDVFLTLGGSTSVFGYGFLDPWLKDYLAEAGEYGGCNWLKGYHEYDMLFYRAFASLDLDAGQREAARSVMSGFEKEMIRLSAEVRVGEIELRELLSARETDLKRVRSKINAVSGYGAEAEFLRVRTREELKGLLTAEQRDRLDAEMSAYGAARGWMWKGMGPVHIEPLPRD